MARKVALGLNGWFIPQFFNRDYIKKRGSEPGTNPWIISCNINTLPLKGYYSVYKSVVKVVAQKEAELAKMKVISLPTIKDMSERQRKHEFTHDKKDFLDTHPKKRLTIKPREGEGNFDQELKIIRGKECVEQFCIWVKDFEEELILTDRIWWSKVESALHSLTTGEAHKEISLAYCTLQCIAKGTFKLKGLWPKEEVKNLWLRTALYKKYTDENKLKLATNGTDKAERNEFYKICYKEAIYCLQIYFFGDYLFGWKVYQQLKRIIACLQPDPVQGVALQAANFGTPKHAAVYIMGARNAQGSGATTTCR